MSGVHQIDRLHPKELKMIVDLMNDGGMDIVSDYSLRQQVSEFTDPKQYMAGIVAEKKDFDTTYITSLKTGFVVEDNVPESVICNSMTLSHADGPVIQSPLGGILSEGADNANTGYGLVVDGSKMYDETSGKIVADGFVDLQPPPDDESRLVISGINMPVVGWASVAGKNSEQVAEINKTCSLPQVEEVSEAGNDIYTPKQNGVGVTSGTLDVTPKLYGTPQPFSPEDSVQVAFPSEVEVLLKQFKTEVVAVYGSMIYEKSYYGATQDDKRLTIVF